MGDDSDLHCQQCGNSGSEQFARVFGDNSNTVPACYSCESHQAIERGAASDATPAVRSGSRTRSSNSTSCAWHS
ncbi:MAG: DUF7563 family protein [Halobacteriota archaeon]